MAQWGTTSESGILRKNKPKDNHEDLLVFGYACKLFRDDEKASYIDKGKHLIPWMGDEKLKIDRYDCRGALSDLAPYEASREGFDAMRWLGLSDSDRKLEELCDKERYHSLHTNEEEEQMYKEEEQKRQKANEFQYSYDVPTNPAQEIGPAAQNVDEEGEKYVPSPHLDVPVDIAIPKTVKENTRIEKTAQFVSKQGLQMEILIKAKQADNPQFGFLNQGHELYKYYRHVLAAIKSGRYQVASAVKNEEEKSSDEVTEPGSGDDHYLHPSLQSISNQSDVQTSSVPSIPYKPSANCAYSQLVNRIQGGAQADVPKPPETFAQMTYDQQQYYQYYYAAQYYEYYKQMAHYQQQNNGQGHPDVHSDPQRMAYAHCVQPQQPATVPTTTTTTTTPLVSTTNSYAQIVSNVVGGREVAKPAAEEPTKTTLQALVQYGGSDSESEPEDDFQVPSGETRIVIDKMAAYVAKNGVQFEEIVKAKGDPRFEFLNENHDYYGYYKSRLRNVGDAPHKEKKVIAPVCFSIKKPKDDAPKEIKSALPVEESDEEASETPIAQEAPPIETQVASKDAEETSNGAVFDADDPILEMIDLTDDAEDKKDARRGESSADAETVTGDEFVPAEDKIKDKLAAAAREKMVSVARDRALQLERKKKAAAFLKLKSAENTSAEEAKSEDLKETKCRSRSRERKEVVQIDDSGDEDKRKRVSKKKKSHKRKHSKSKHDSRAKKKSKKKRRRSDSCSSTNSKSS